MPEQILTTDLQEHPAFRAWASLGPDHSVPDRIERLEKKKKSAVFRLPGVGPGGSAVVAKRCRRESARVERAIYSEILPRLPISALRYFGFADEPEGRFSWVFMEDAGDLSGPRAEPDWSLVARWLALLHAGAAEIPAAYGLPARGPGHYFDGLRSARETILQNLGNPLLRPQDLAELKLIVAQCDFIEARRNEIEEFCGSMPQTLVHGDLVSKNMRVRDGETGPSLLLFDWETAGWGTPAADLAELQGLSEGQAALALYAAVFRESRPQVDPRDLERLAAWGRVFRLLAMIGWESCELPYNRVRKAMGSMRYYRRAMAGALNAEGWTEGEP